MRQWLVQHQVEAVAMEATGIYWQRPSDLLREAGIESSLYSAPQIKQLRERKTDIQDSRWLALVCQFGLGCASYVTCRTRSFATWSYPNNVETS